MMARSTARVAALAGVLGAMMLAIAGCSPSPEQRLERASTQFAQGDYARASIELRNLLQDQPDNVQGRLLLGLTAERLGDWPAAEEHLGRARTLGAAPADYALPLAGVLTELRRSAAALGVLEDVAADRRDARWHTARGRALLGNDQREAARRAFQQALDLEADHYDALLGLARLAAAENDPAGARSLADRAVRLAPRRPEAFHLIGTLQLQAGSLSAAAESFGTAADLETGASASTGELNALFGLAQVQLARNDRPALADVRDRLLARAPEAPITQFVAAAVEHLEGHYREAALYLQQIAGAGQDNLQIQLLTGANHLALGAHVQAEQALLRVLALQPGQVNAIRLLAESRRRQGRPRAALDALRDLPDDRDPQLLALRGVLHLEDQQPDTAVSLLEQASAAAPRQPAIQLQLARAYLAAGRTADAVALFDGPIAEGAGEAVETAVSLLAGYAASQDSEAAEAEAVRVLTRRPDDAQAALGVGLFRQALGDAAGAREALTQSLRLDPELPATRLTLAGLALAEADGEEAARQYRALLERRPDHVPAMLGLAQVAREAGRLDEAAAQLTRAIDTDPDTLAPRLALARLELGRDALEAARAAIDAAAVRHPGNPEIATFDGLLRFREGQGEAAVAAFRQAATGDPERAERWLNLGRAEAAAGHLAGARESLQRALRLAPGAAPTLATLAQVELELGAFEAARDHARALQRAQPQAAEGYRIEADVSAAEGEWRDADRLYVSAYERRPEFDTAFRSYQARREAGIAEPAALLARWAQRRPEDSRARLLLAQQLQAEGAAAAAVREYRAVIQRDPDNVVALNNAAWLLGEAGEPDQGLEYATRALAQAPEAAPVLDTYGWLLVQSGRVVDGLSYLERAVALAPRAPELRLHLGRAQVQAGQRAAARQTLGGLLEAHPEFAQREGVDRLLAELQD